MRRVLQNYGQQNVFQPTPMKGRGRARPPGAPLITADGSAVRPYLPGIPNPEKTRHLPPATRHCYTRRMNLFRKKEICVPTGSGWGLFAGAAFLLLFFIWIGLCPFLAVNRPQPGAEILLVEGWLHDSALEQVLHDYRPGQKIVTTGCSFEIGRQLLGIETYAEVSTARLIALGVNETNIVTAPARTVMRDRTYAAAVAAREKMKETGLFGAPVTIYTTGAHSRRTLLLFQHAFGADYPLGIVSLDPADFPIEKWRHYSEGVKHVLMEGIAWVYARLTVFTYD